MNDVNQLMTEATKQLAEHQEWLAVEIDKLPADVAVAGAKILLVAQTRQIRLRVARVDKGNASVVWEYPDELAAFLRSEHTPKHLRDSLAGGQVVNTEQPASSLTRVHE